MLKAIESMNNADVIIVIIGITWIIAVTCFQALQDVVSQNSLTLHWIPAHKGYDGNKVVESLAKNTAAHQNPQPSHSVEVFQNPLL
jgi:hypothetical protein